MQASERILWQRIQRHSGARPDGRPGLQTALAIATSLGLSTEMDESATAWHPWPRDNDAEMQAFYGPPGGNLKLITPPYQLYYDGKPVQKITVHAKIAKAVLNALRSVLAAYGEQEIKRLKLDDYNGCLNVRPKRGGTSLSVHAYAAALDFGAKWNTLHMDHTQALYAGPDYEPWWQAWEREGAVSLGRTADYDWMHIQFARLP